AVKGNGLSTTRQSMRKTRVQKFVAYATYLFSVVGTSRCDVRAACSGATPSIALVARIFVPPATTRAWTAQRALPTIAIGTTRFGRIQILPRMRNCCDWSCGHSRVPRKLRRLDYL